MISNSYNPNQKNGKKELKTKHIIYIIFALLVVLAGIGAGIYYWPEDKNPVEIQTSAADEDPNNIAGEAFLDSIAKQPGIQSLGGGIYYKSIKTGNGQKPGDNSTVKVNYEGRLVNGKVFDSSYKRNKPAEFPVSGVITGWQIALKAMPVGSIWEIYIPQYYAYGPQGSGSDIPPYSTLVFKVELLDVK